MNEENWVVSVNAKQADGTWEGLTEFYFDTGDEAFHFFDSEAEELIPAAYKHISGIVEFEVAIWDDSCNDGEALEVMTVKPTTNKE